MMMVFIVVENELVMSFGARVVVEILNKNVFSVSVV